MMEVEQSYFESYGNIEVHKLMLEDKPRNEAYRKAIIDNASIIKGKTVLDIGAGTGILSIFCAHAGASKVYAVEASETYKIAQNIVNENNFNHIVEVIHCKIEDLQLQGDQKVDIIVSEWMGFYLLHEGMLDSVIYARDKFLKPDGIMFPESATIYAAPCSFPNFFSQWDNVEGVSMKSFAKLLQKSATDKPQTDIISSDDVIAIPEVVFWCDLRTVSTSDLDSIEMQHVYVANRNALYQGVGIWFTCMFPSFGKLEPVMLSTDPEDAPTHWKQTVIVLPQEIQVEKDEPIVVNLKMMRSIQNQRHYNIEFTMLDPEEIDHPEYCTCYMTKCIVIRAAIKQYEEAS